MTREEIIRNLKYTMKKHKNDIVHTFDTNISVMCKDILDYFEEQEPCDKCNYVEGSPFCLQYCPYDAERKKEQEPCEDAISREDAIAEMEELNAVSFYEANEHSKEAYYEIKNMIKTIPSVTQKSGKWIETEYHRWRCSVCREKGVSEWDNIHAVRTNFCPDCGAKMESEDKE